MKLFKMGLSCATFMLLSGSFAFAQQKAAPSAPPPAAAQKAAEKTAEPAKDAEKKTPPVPEDKVVQTKHSARIGGQEIKYTASAGMLVMKTEEGMPKASVFYVAYTRDDVSDMAQRPVMFTFNG
jgi:carboxypeptidase C (cathepsin A)